jgi:hypothetical protein
VGDEIDDFILEDGEYEGTGRAQLLEKREWREDSARDPSRGRGVRSFTSQSTSKVSIPSLLTTQIKIFLVHNLHIGPPTLPPFPLAAPLPTTTPRPPRQYYLSKPFLHHSLHRCHHPRLSPHLRNRILPLLLIFQASRPPIPGPPDTPLRRTPRFHRPLGRY